MQVNLSQPPASRIIENSGASSIVFIRGYACVVPSVNCRFGVMIDQPQNQSNALLAHPDIDRTPVNPSQDFAVRIVLEQYPSSCLILRIGGKLLFQVSSLFGGRLGCRATDPTVKDRTPIRRERRRLGERHALQV